MTEDSPLQAALRAAGTPDPRDPEALTAAKIRGLLYGYSLQWRTSDLEILSVEDVVEAPLWNLTTSKFSRTFRLAGKLDVRVRDGDQLAVIDHKSTSEEITDPASPYWRQQVIEGQWLQYAVIEWLNARKLDYVLLDVVRKPAIAPRELSKKSLLDLSATGAYFGRALSAESLRFARAEQRESLEMYEARLAHDCSEARPEWYFAQKKLVRLNSELREYMLELWQDGLDIRDERLKAVHTRNSGACLAYGTPCQFLGVCSGHDTDDSDRWKKKKNVHEELPGLEGDGRNVLTNSRLKMFKLCKRKHNYLYNVGLEKQEPSAAREFGSRWHECLAEYFLALKKEQEQRNGSIDIATEADSRLAGAEGRI